MRDHSSGRTARACAWGILIGGAVGFAVGLLTAPEAGGRTRKRLAYQLDHLGSQVTDVVEQVLNNANTSDARRAGDALVADAKERAQRIRQDIDAMIGEIRQHKKAG